MEITTNTLTFTFNSPKIPESLKVCYLNIPESQFVPNLLRCCKCQKFMLRVNASTVKSVQDDRKLVIRMIHIPKHSNALTVENVVLLLARNAVFIKGSMTFSQSECRGIFHFFEARTMYQKTHGQKVMIYDGALKAQIQIASVCTQTDVSWVGPQSVTRKQHSAVSSTNMPVSSVSRSVCTIEETLYN